MLPLSSRLLSCSCDSWTAGFSKQRLATTARHKPPNNEQHRTNSSQADKAASSANSGFSFFGGKAEKWENAADLYTQAANAFRMQKLTREAGQAFERAASIQRDQLSEPDDAANTLVEAFKVYRKESPQDAARCLKQSINHYTSKGNFRRAATHMQNLGEVWEELSTTLAPGSPDAASAQKEATEAFETAASWYETDGAEALSNKLLLKVADLSALAGDYGKAIELFERVAKSSVQNNLMKWSVKEYLLKAGICYLAQGDMVATNRAWNQFVELDPSFQQQREWMLLCDLKQAVEEGEEDKVCASSVAVLVALLRRTVKNVQMLRMRLTGASLRIVCSSTIRCRNSTSGRRRSC